MAKRSADSDVCRPKLYTVDVGTIGEGGEGDVDMPKWMSFKVIARDVREAMSKVRLSKGEYISGCHLETVVDHV